MLSIKNAYSLTGEKPIMAEEKRISVVLIRNVRVREGDKTNIHSKGETKSYPASFARELIANKKALTPEDYKEAQAEAKADKKEKGK